MAHETHVFTSKKSGASPRRKTTSKRNPFITRQFFTAVDEGSSKPSFCYPSKRQMFSEEVESLQKAVDGGFIEESRKMEAQHRLNQRRARLDEIEKCRENAVKIINKDVDGWKKEYSRLAEEISNGMPTRKDVKDKRVNPFSNLKREKQGGLESAKRDYQIIGRALTEATGEHHETNVGFLQKDS
jgi:hypothetical protein